MFRFDLKLFVRHCEECPANSGTFMTKQPQLKYALGKDQLLKAKPPMNWGCSASKFEARNDI